MNKNTSVSAETPSSWYQWTLAALAFATLLFGFWGHWLYETTRYPAHPPDFLSVLYHTCQLFVAHGVHLDGTIPWQLHAGRLFGAALLFTAAFIAFLKFFRDEMLIFRLRLPWRSNHVLICGLGDLGLRLALDARRRGKFVVAIEKQGNFAAIEQARKSGALVIEGDACDAVILQKARVDRAEFVVAACQEDKTNVAIAALVGQALPPTLQRSEPLVCRLLIKDPELRVLLSDESLFPVGSGGSAASQKSNYRINFRDLHVHDTAARQALRQYPLDFQPIRKDDDTIVHLVVAGFGPMGQSLALHAARLGHFGNSVTKGRRLHITVVDRDATSGFEAFRARYPKIETICEVRFHQADRAGSSFIETLDQLSYDNAEQKELFTIGMCFEKDLAKDQTADDAENLRIGIELSRRAKRDEVQILIYQSTRSGFGAIFPAGAKGAGLSPRLHAFGMLEDIFAWDTLLRESEDRLARTLHEDYREERRKEGALDAQNPGWEMLPENLKESNRRAADHIAIKLRGLGYHYEPLQPGKDPIGRFTDDEILLLAQMEHLSWCAERWLDGWEYGPDSNKEKKINRCLVKWDQLLPKDQIKDPEQINTISRALNKIGCAIYR